MAGLPDHGCAVHGVATWFPVQRVQLSHRRADLIAVEPGRRADSRHALIRSAESADALVGPARRGQPGDYREAASA